VTFTTFNYDVSLERHVANGLRHIEMFNDQVDEFFQSHPVLHVYGKIRENPTAGYSLLPAHSLPLDPNEFRRDSAAATQKYRTMKGILDTAYDAAQQIRTIDPHEKGGGPDLDAVREAIAKAECVYVLGYGFDVANSDRLELPKLLRYRPAKKLVVLFTNYGDSNVVNKRASRLFTDHFDDFLPPKTLWQSGSSSYYCEKSTKTVYDALASDFDSVEEEAGYPLP
jgi:hypothetical protein